MTESYEYRKLSELLKLGKKEVYSFEKMVKMSKVFMEYYKWRIG